MIVLSIDEQKLEELHRLGNCLLILSDRKLKVGEIVALNGCSKGVKARILSVEKGEQPGTIKVFVRLTNGHPLEEVCGS